MGFIFFSLYAYYIFFSLSRSTKSVERGLSRVKDIITENRFAKGAISKRMVISVGKDVKSKLPPKN